MNNPDNTYQGSSVKGLTRVSPQMVKHSDGWSVRNAGRELVRYQEGERCATIGIDRGDKSSRLYTDSLLWLVADGAELPVVEPDRAIILNRIQDGLAAIEEAPLKLFSRALNKPQ